MDNITWGRDYDPKIEEVDPAFEQTCDNEGIVLLDEINRMPRFGTVAFFDADGNVFYKEVELPPLR